MTQIAIADKVAADLAAAAANRGCSQEDLASILIEEGLLREDADLELSPAQLDRLIESVAQAKRGEFVDGDVVMARFDAALRKIESQ